MESWLNELAWKSVNTTSFVTVKNFSFMQQWRLSHIRTSSLIKMPQSSRHSIKGPKQWWIYNGTSYIKKILFCLAFYRSYFRSGPYYQIAG